MTDGNGMDNGHTSGKGNGRIGSKRAGDKHSHPQYTPEQIIDALEQARGMVAAAARILGCHRDTIYVAMDQNKEVARARILAKEAQKDRAELSLFSLIEQGNVAAICFYLKCQAKDRGYVERVEFTGRNGDPIQIADREETLTILNERLARIAAARGKKAVAGSADHGPVGRA